MDRSNQLQRNYKVKCAKINAIFDIEGKNMWAPRVTVAAIVEDQGRFLMVEEIIDGKSLLNQPAGHLEPGESLLQAVCRETLEETAWILEPQALVGVYRWVHPDSNETFLRSAFCGQARPGPADATLDPDIHQVHWLTPEQIHAWPWRSPLVGRCLQDYLAGRRYALDLLLDIDS